ncbi:MAG: hypothetical protein FWH56_06000, partial [Betaproteobacteria bacterium]|nr:hypothetical protein [Betaproteobacteria bacterium]
GTATMIEDVAAVEDVFEGIEMLDKYKGTWFENEARENFLKGREEGLKKGLEKGREEGLISVARNMLKCGKSVNEIVEATGLQPETIQSLMH